MHLVVVWFERVHIVKPLKFPYVIFSHNLPRLILKMMLRGTQKKWHEARISLGGEEISIKELRTFAKSVWNVWKMINML